MFNPSPDSLRACGAQAQIEARLIFTGLKDLPKHSSFNFLVEGAPLHVLGEMRLRVECRLARPRSRLPQSFLIKLTTSCIA